MKKTILLGKCNDNLLKFLKNEFNCEQLEIINDKDFNTYHLEDYIISNEIENIFISDISSYKYIFYKKGFIDSPIFSSIKNIFLITETKSNLIDFSNNLPFIFSDNSLNLENKKNIFKGGILNKDNRTKDIIYRFYPKFNFFIDEDLIIFKKSELKENELYIDFSHLNNFYSLLSKLNIEKFLPIISKKEGEVILFSNLKLKNNEKFYKSIITKEINR